MRGLAGLFVPDTGIVDYTAVTEAYAACVRDAGGNVVTGARVTACRRDPSPGGAAPAIVLETPRGSVRCGALVNCAGLYSDRVARLCGVEPGVRIVPFRGEYYDLVPDRRELVRNLVYPVPDPAFPFLGVHFTRRVHGGIEAGPNAVLALKREGYTRTSFSAGDLAELLAFGLRTVSGWERTRFRECTGFDYLDLRGDILRRLAAERLLALAPGRVRPTRRGLLFADHVARELL